MKKFALAILVCLVQLSAFTQTSDDAFKKPLVDVLKEIQARYGISIRYPEELVKDKWVTYAQWRYRPDAEQTLSNILASQDLTFAKEGEKKYKIQAFQYHLKTVEEGKEQLTYLSSLYNDVQTSSVSVRMTVLMMPPRPDRAVSRCGSRVSRSDRGWLVSACCT